MGFMDMLFGGGTDNGRVQEMLNDGAVIIDVRTPGEFQGGHVVGSKNIPLQEVGSKVKKLKKLNKPIVLCCASGSRSGHAVSILKPLGIDCENGGSWTRVNSMV